MSSPPDRDPGSGPDSSGADGPEADAPGRGADRAARHRDEEEWVTAAPDDPMDRAVEQLLDEVEVETQPSPILSLGGLRGHVAIVTGASSGIGRAVALELARCGVDIAFNYLDDGTGRMHRAAEEVSRALRELEVRVFCRSCDIRDPEGVEGFVTEAEDTLGGLHILVNNAGIQRDRAIWRMSDDAWRDVLETNLTGMFHTIRAVAPYFRAQEYGKVVNVASVHGLRPEFGIANFGASKAGVIGLTQSAAVDLGSSNVNVNAVAPGYIRTTRLTDSVPTEKLDEARSKTVLGRLGDPQDVANVVLFLCSEAARHITGAVVPVDGGYLL